MCAHQDSALSKAYPNTSGLFVSTERKTEARTFAKVYLWHRVSSWSACNISQQRLKDESPNLRTLGYINQSYACEILHSEKAGKEASLL